MMGAASRISALAIAVCAITGTALAQGSPDAANPAQGSPDVATPAAASSDVTDRDRLWANFTREAAIVGHRHFWLELRGMALMNDQSIRQSDGAGGTFEGPTLNLAGYPLNRPTKCKGLDGEPGCVTEINGGRFDLVAAYGLLSTLEVGMDFPFVMLQDVTFAGGADGDTVDVGDLQLYGKFKRQLAEHWAGALGLEINTATGSSSKGFGTGHTGLNPFLSARYQSGRVALGSHVGFLLNVDDPPDVFNWSLQGIVRANQLFAFRCEFNGRLFRTGGTTFNDIAVWPGLDVNLTDYFVIRPQALAHLTDDAINWGLGLGLAIAL
jgi:hypothetical protein